MKKVMSLVAMFAMSGMLAGCYSKACEEPVPAPAPYKDSAPVMQQEEPRPAHHYKHHHKAKHHHKKHHKMAGHATQDTTTTTTETKQETTMETTPAAN